MSKKQYPNKQPFNIRGKRNETRVNSWWNPTSRTYWKNK